MCIPTTQLEYLWTVFGTESWHCWWVGYVCMCWLVNVFVYPVHHRQTCTHVCLDPSCQWCSSISAGALQARRAVVAAPQQLTLGAGHKRQLELGAWSMHYRYMHRFLTSCCAGASEGCGIQQSYSSRHDGATSMHPQPHPVVRPHTYLLDGALLSTLLLALALVQGCVYCTIHGVFQTLLRQC